uniref:RRM domain-containing protein n=1 Tax=Mola mola TaxID=94237 RepID=A0A3Q3VXK2_MOLML
MADVSLDEVIRQRVCLFFSPLGFQVKDAREKLGQKDARFKIRGRGGAGGIQDARQKINSRKQGQSQFSIAVQAAQMSAVTHHQKSQTPVPHIQIHNNSVGSTFSMTGPITKVVKNDAYTAPRPPAPVAPTRPTSSMAATRSSAAALQPPAFSPLEGTKITVNNLHPRVTEEDIVELFCVCGALKRARLVKVGVAEVVFVRKEDAVSAYRKYNNRCLDGQPMKCNLHIQGNVITSDQPILLRLSDTPGTNNGTKKDGLPSSLSRTSSQRASSQPTPEVDPQTILKALFKSTTQSTSTTEPPSSQATAFRIKI